MQQKHDMYVKTIIDKNNIEKQVQCTLNPFVRMVRPYEHSIIQPVQFYICSAMN